MNVLLHLILKEYIQIRRTRALLVITFAIPIIQLLILGLAVSGDIVRIPTIITDLDNTPFSRSLVAKLGSTEHLNVIYHSSDMTSAPKLLNRGDVILSLTIPANFQRDIMRKESPTIGLDADAQNSTVALTAAGYVRGIVLSWFSERASEMGVIDTQVRQVDMKANIWYNPELRNINFMIPGIVVLLVTIVTIILTSLSIVKEREAGTLEQILVTPMSKSTLVLGKTLPFLILGFFEMWFALAVAKVVYDIPFEGSPATFSLIALLYIFCTLGVGILISTISKTQQQALFITWFFLIFFVLMSGFFLPLDTMPEWIHTLTYLNPLRYFTTVVRDILLKGYGIRELYMETIAIAVLGAGTLAFSINRFSRHLG